MEEEKIVLGEETGEEMDINTLNERFALVMERISQIPGEELVCEPFRSFFAKTAQEILRVTSFVILKRQRARAGLTDEEYRRFNDWFFEDVRGSAYETSWTNPAYAIAQLGSEHKDIARILSFLAAEVRAMIPLAYEGNFEEIVVIAELFSEIYGTFADEIPEAEELKNRIYWCAFDYAPLFVERQIDDRVNPNRDFALRIVMEADSAIAAGSRDMSYLYRFGEYITEDDVRFATFIAELPEEDIRSMARTYTEGYRTGFVNAGKDLSIKSAVDIYWQLGFERVIAEAVRQFEEMGLRPVMRRGFSSALMGRNAAAGYHGSVPSRQFLFDHEQDKALFLDRRFVTRYADTLKQAFEDRKELARGMAGPAVVEFFGEEPFTPDANGAGLRFDEYQNSLKVEMTAKAMEITNTYIPGEERSFTIISFPRPEIGEQFEEIFRETIRINTLDVDLYREVQQKLIDALDQAAYVVVKGMGRNRTDLKVAMQHLDDPARQTNFENCLADVNIPVGEVFTSPELDGTNGVLHVTGVYLNDLYFKDLALTFEDGVITEYSCRNFEDEEENLRYIRDFVLFNHKTLPIGEFAIGTNTAASVMMDRFDIAGKMPILIAEKTGPHFAVGDTCYSHDEDNAVFNPDGKEITARENRFSRLRGEDITKAYFNCHTDITIPYEELGEITAVRPNGTEIEIISRGRFVLAGTEVLNEELNRGFFGNN